MSVSIKTQRMERTLNGNRYHTIARPAAMMREYAQQNPAATQAELEVAKAESHKAFLAAVKANAANISARIDIDDPDKESDKALEGAQAWVKWVTGQGIEGFEKPEVLNFSERVRRDGSGSFYSAFVGRNVGDGLPF